MESGGEFARREGGAEGGLVGAEHLAGVVAAEPAPPEGEEEGGWAADITEQHGAGW